MLVEQEEIDFITFLLDNKGSSGNISKCVYASSRRTRIRRNVKSAFLVAKRKRVAAMDIFRGFIIEYKILKTVTR